MSPLFFILKDLQETAVTLGELQGRISKHPDDDILQVNAETLAKRRRDLELQLDRELRDQQLDVIRYQIEHHHGAAAIPVAGIAHALLLFQGIVTSVFDALRDHPKSTYSPSAESLALSAMTLASAKMVPPIELSLAMSNDRLLALESDLDVTFEAVLALLQSYTPEALKQMAARVGVSPLSQTYRWAENSVEHRLTTSITWQKSADQAVTVAVSAEDALLLQTTIASMYLERAADFDTEIELVALDDNAGTFAGRAPQGQLAGFLDESFPRRRGWTIHKRYAAALTRLLRIRCSDGQEETHWTLRQLTDRT